MVDLVPEQIPWLFSGITVRRDALRSRRDALNRFLRATIEGNYLALSDEKRAKDMLAKELKITDPRIIDISYNDFKQQSPPDLEPSRQGAENILAQFPGGSRKTDDYVDAGVLDDLKKGASSGDAAEIRQAVTAPCVALRANGPWRNPSAEHAVGSMTSALAALHIVVIAVIAARGKRSRADAGGFFKGRQITFLIGAGAGGGYDAYYRTFARYLVRHIPGAPTIVPKNMPAARALRPPTRSTPRPTARARPSGRSPTISRWTRCSAIRARASTPRSSIGSAASASSRTSARPGSQARSRPSRRRASAK